MYSILTDSNLYVCWSYIIYSRNDYYIFFEKWTTLEDVREMHFIFIACEFDYISVVLVYEKYIKPYILNHLSFLLMGTVWKTFVADCYRWMI